MTVTCPYCMNELVSRDGNICPSCGQRIMGEQVSGAPGVGHTHLADSPRDRLIHFHTTLLQMTPRTWAIPAIVGANVLVFLAMLSAGAGLFGPGMNMMLHWGANYGPLTLGGEWWRLFTCTFLHFGIIHIAFNMYVLWQIGHFVERLVGNAGLIVLYVTSGIAASIASLAWNSTVISAGASGAVFGVCGALVGFIALRRDTIPLEVIKGLRSSMVTFVIYNGAFALMMPSIDWAAHAGGFVYGILCGLVLSQPVVRQSTQSRWLRNGLLAAVSAIVLPGAFFALPAAPPDVFASLDSISLIEKESLTKAMTLIGQWQDEAITGEQLADSLEKDVLPSWQIAVEQFQSLGKQSIVNPEFVSHFGKYLLKRQESMQLLVEGIRNQNPEKLNRSTSAWQEAEALSAQLRAGEK